GHLQPLLEAHPRRPPLPPPAPVQGHPRGLPRKGAPQEDGPPPRRGPALPAAPLDSSSPPHDRLGPLDLRRGRGLPQRPHPPPPRPGGDPDHPPRPPGG